MCACPGRDLEPWAIHLRTHHAAGDPTSAASLSTINLDSTIDGLDLYRPPKSPAPRSLSSTPSQGQQPHLHHHQQRRRRHSISTSCQGPVNVSDHCQLRHSRQRHSHDHERDDPLVSDRRQQLHSFGSWNLFSLFAGASSPNISCSSDNVATVRSSRLDKHLHSNKHNTFWPSGFDSLRRIVVGAVRCPALPPFSFTMSLRSKIPETPRVISPSPTPSERDASDYTGPVTRSAARRRTPTPQPLEEHAEEDDDSDPPELRRARTRSRSPIDHAAVKRLSRRMSNASKAGKITKDAIPEEPVNVNGNASTNGNGKAVATNGHLAPPTPSTSIGWSWRDFSRSPSPLGLIPIHRHFRTFVHKHEVPRKVLHVSIGFFVIWLYVTGTQTTSVTPWLMSALIPITTVDWLRHRYASFNRFYVKVLGALMRESEYNGWNGVIFYLLGAWIVLYSFPKDVGIMSVLLLSWCDTAASTFGRLWGRYTPRIRRGKSLAGSIAAFLVGVGTSYFFYGWLVPTIGPFPGDENFMFQGVLSLPKTICEAVGVSRGQASITGALALGAMSLWSGFVASASEAVDIFGWDDNLTIPVLSGIGIWGFLKVFS
ncbi:hypothetical protein NCS57_00690300 [Fusarium keratoplasticum]|uniref:Uncharacterized protein n=1 Tax=Fusarium keratoplasticum TaxID=1328300 RepID=A0ACC0QYB8_9HYPO|nr:hypothetical protein NCS57_00690300 [Fusarium keratoplasticum]KAI8668776.1 hypothetical protein NCS57_00690300 [Fusarium keratoplasticum]